MGFAVVAILNLSVAVCLVLSRIPFAVMGYDFR